MDVDCGIGAHAHWVDRLWGSLLCETVFAQKGVKPPVRPARSRSEADIAGAMSGNGSTRALVLNSKAPGQIAILSSLVARKATFLLALI